MTTIYPASAETVRSHPSKLPKSTSSRRARAHLPKLSHWTVHPTTALASAHVDLNARTIYIPMRGGACARHTAFHEIGHILYSPMKPCPDFHTPTQLRLYRYIEDVRVNTLLTRHIHLPISTFDPSSPEDAQERLRLSARAPTSGVARILMALLTVDTPYHGTVSLPAHEQQLVDNTIASLWRNGPPSHADAIRVTHELLASSPSWQPSPIPQQPAPSEGQGLPMFSDIATPSKALAKEAGVPAMGEAPEASATGGQSTPQELQQPTPGPEPLLQEALDRVLAAGISTGSENSLNQSFFGSKVRYDQKKAISAEEARWLPMNILQPRLSQPASGSRRLRSSPRWVGGYEEGTILRSLHRYASDGAIFARRRKSAPALTVLVDWSGSMHLSPGNMARLAALTRFSRVTLAYYSSGRTVYSSGHTISSGSQQEGALVVVADHGRMLPTGQWAIYRAGGNNGCDGPALQWLNRHTGLKVWVSDGGITGRAGTSQRALLRECYKHCQQGQIVQVPTVELLLRLLTSDDGPDLVEALLTHRASIAELHWATPVYYNGTPLLPLTSPATWQPESNERLKAMREARIDSDGCIVVFAAGFYTLLSGAAAGVVLPAPWERTFLKVLSRCS
jgi:hypothetical protein